MKKLKWLFILSTFLIAPTTAQCSTPFFAYENHLTPIKPTPILGYYPDFFNPIYEERHFEGPPLIIDPNADMKVRIFRYSYNVRGIIEIDNFLDSKKTAVLIAHPWGVDRIPLWMDSDRTGAVFYSTPSKNQIFLDHAAKVTNPILHQLRGKVKNIIYSLPGKVNDINKKIYRTTATTTTPELRAIGHEEYKKLYENHHCKIQIPHLLTLDSERIFESYFEQFPYLIDNPCCRNLPKLVTSEIDVAIDDVVFFDDQGYAELKKFLKANGIKNILLGGYANSRNLFLDVTTANFESLSNDFNVIILGDITMALFPCIAYPEATSTDSITKIAQHQFITQFSWIDFQ